MQKLPLFIILVSIFSTPNLTLGAPGKCIEGDCEKGKGTMTYPDGTRYEGQWANGLPNGQGVKTLEGGMQFFGEFKNGIMYGSGTMVMPDGSKLKVKWNNALSPQKTGNRPDTAVERDKGKKERSMVATSDRTRNLLNPDIQQPAGQIEVSQKDLAAEEETPSREPDRSAGLSEQVAPQEFREDEVTVIDAVPEEEITRIKLTEAKKIKSGAPISVEKKAAPEPEVISPQNLKATKTVEYASIAVGANIRSNASLDSEVLRTAPPGYPVAVLERQTDWLLVEDYRGRTGWVFASLVTEPGTVIIRVFKGNLRRGPSLKDDIIAKLDHGTTMSVLERSGEWLKVSDSKGLTGWLHHKIIWPAAEFNTR